MKTYLPTYSSLPIEIRKKELPEYVKKGGTDR